MKRKTFRLVYMELLTFAVFISPMPQFIFDKKIDLYGGLFGIALGLTYGFVGFIKGSHDAKKGRWIYPVRNINYLLGLVLASPFIFAFILQKYYLSNCKYFLQNVFFVGFNIYFLFSLIGRLFLEKKHNNKFYCETIFKDKSEK